MCGFFAFSTGLSPREISNRLGLTILPRTQKDIESLKFYPKSPIPTISKNSPNQLVMRYWSLVPRWWMKSLDELKFSTFNARSEDIDSKATYKTPWKLNQRCLIPCTWFYEFAKEKDENNKDYKQPYRVETSDTDIFTMAGLYETWKNSDGTELQSVTIITCEAKGDLKRVHQRQPIIIEEGDREKWLDRSIDSNDVKKFLIPDDKLRVNKIDRAFNKAFGGMVTEKMVKSLAK